MSNRKARRDARRRDKTLADHVGYMSRRFNKCNDMTKWPVEICNKCGYRRVDENSSHEYTARIASLLPHTDEYCAALVVHNELTAKGWLQHSTVDVHQHSDSVFILTPKFSSYLQPALVATTGSRGMRGLRSHTTINWGGACADLFLRVEAALGSANARMVEFDSGSGRVQVLYVLPAAQQMLEIAENIFNPKDADEFISAIESMMLSFKSEQ